MSSKGSNARRAHLSQMDYQHPKNAHTVSNSQVYCLDRRSTFLPRPHLNLSQRPTFHFRKSREFDYNCEYDGSLYEQSLIPQEKGGSSHPTLGKNSKTSKRGRKTP